MASSVVPVMPSGRPLRGRARECGELLQLIAKARSGQSGVVVVRGEPGIGKTALLDYALTGVDDSRTARVGGVEPEMELPFAGLHQLCAPFLDRAAGLPPPQRDALATAFGTTSGAPPDRFLVGLAVLTLLADVASDRPLLLVVDDVQWLDRISVQVLAFVARRLRAEPIAMIFASRSDDDPELRGLPELRLAGLGTRDAAELLDSVLHGRLDEHVRNRLLGEARGNPLALVELPRALDPDVPSASTGWLPRPVASRIEDGFGRQIARLPARTRSLLLLAAIEPVGDASLLWRAATWLGLAADDALPAEEAGLLSIRNRVRFRHPLLRSAARRSASLDEERQAHDALARAIGRGADPDRRAWHRALATAGTDETVAADLEASADRARQRGGVAAEAAFLARAVSLTPDPRRRAERALAAAAAKLRAGLVDDCVQLLSTVDEAALSELDRARMALLGAQAGFAADRGRDAAPRLLEAARQLEPLDAPLARETYLDAISAAMFAGRFADTAGVEEVARAARSAPPSGPAPALGDELLDALATLFTDGYAAAVPVARAMVDGLRRREVGSGDLRHLWLAAAVAADLWDDRTWQLLAREHVRVARETGALAELPLALNSRAITHVFAGELDAAAALVAETRTVTESTRTDLSSYGAMAVAAWRAESSAHRLIERGREDATSRGEGVGLSVSFWCSALLYVGHGKFEAALGAARQAAVDTREVAVSKWALVELVEAAIRARETRIAAEAFERLADLTATAGGDWALGIAARARALLAPGAKADGHHREAIERLARTSMRPDLARAHLLFGEWLQGEGRRLPARRQLEIAHDMFEHLGAAAFAARARRALQETGATVPRRSPKAAVGLTDQEAQIAHLAGVGLTNPEIGAQLFLSPHTVEWHLRKVYTKLDIRGRRQLPERLSRETGTAVPT